MSLLRRLRIGPRLAAAFAALGLSLIVVAGVGAEKMHGLKSESRHIDQRQVPALTLAAELAANQAHVGDLLSRYLYVYVHQPAEKAKVARDIKAVDARDRAIDAKLASELRGTGAADTLASYTRIDDKADELRDRIVSAAPVAARALYLTDMAGVSTELDQATSGLIGAVKDEVSATVAREERDASAGTRIMIVVGALALALAALLAVLITLTVVRPVRDVVSRLRRLDEQDFTALSQGLEAAAGGDLTHPAECTTEGLEPEGADEMTELTRTLNSMLAKARLSIEGYER